MRQMTYSLVRLGAYEKLKTHLSNDGKSSTARLLLAACIAGGLGGIAGNPAGAHVKLYKTNITMPIITPNFRYYPGTHD